MSANTTLSFLRGCAAAGRVSRFRARVPFFFCQKKGTKENHLNLRFKNPLARRGVYEFGSMYSRMKYAGYHCRSKGLCLRSPARRLARPLASATVGAIFFYRMGDYQIAPKPPGGRLWLVAADAAGEFKTPPARRDEGFTPLRGYTSSVSLRLTPVSLRVGRFAGLTGHRPVIQHREPPQGEG